jgi:SAM-dependent methyltransferase
MSTFPLGSPSGDDVERITQRTYDRIARDYCRDTPRWDVRQVILASALEFLSYLEARSTILVLGAGDGRDAQLFASAGHRPVLLDYSRAMLDLAAQRLPGADTIMADFRRIPLADSSVDAVWASACLYHIRKSSLRATLARVRAVLRPGGHLYLNLRSGEGELLDPAPRSFPSGGPRFYAFYSQAEVLDLLAIFEILKLQRYDRVLGFDYFQLWLKTLPEVHNVQR